MKNVLTLVLLIMSASGTPSAALVPGRITENRGQKQYESQTTGSLFSFNLLESFLRAVPQEGLQSKR